MLSVVHPIWLRLAQWSALHLCFPSLPFPSQSCRYGFQGLHQRSKWPSRTCHLMSILKPRSNQPGPCCEMSGTMGVTQPFRHIFLEALLLKFLWLGRFLWIRSNREDNQSWCVSSYLLDQLQVPCIGQQLSQMMLCLCYQNKLWLRGNGAILSARASEASNLYQLMTLLMCVH